MTALNIVTVTASLPADPTTDPATFPQGHYELVPTGMAYDADQHVMIVPVMKQGKFTDGAISVPLVASDNFAAGVLTWDVHVELRGVENIDVPQVSINYTDGASQDLFTILSSAGWVPPSKP